MIGQSKPVIADPDVLTDVLRHTLIGGIKRLLEHDVPPGTIVGMLANEIADLVSTIRKSERDLYLKNLFEIIQKQTEQHASTKFSQQFVVSRGRA